VTKILVIDDDALMRNTIAKILRSGGFEVVEAEDGVKGLSQFHRERPDLVITDILMPDREGIATILEIRRGQPSARIIAISGGGRVGRTDFLEMAKSLGGIAVMAKPFLPKDLISHVRNCLSN
jgi:DNA-binding response OmpR family regulator